MLVLKFIAWFTDEQIFVHVSLFVVELLIFCESGTFKFYCILGVNLITWKLIKKLHQIVGALIELS